MNGKEPETQSELKWIKKQRSWVLFFYRRSVKNKWSRNRGITRTREYRLRLPLLSKINDFMIAKAQQHQLQQRLHTAPLTGSLLLSLTAHFTKLQRMRNPLSANNSQFNKSGRILQAPASDEYWRTDAYIQSATALNFGWAPQSATAGADELVLHTVSVRCPFLEPPAKLGEQSVQKKAASISHNSPGQDSGRQAGLSHAPDLKAETLKARFIRIRPL